MTQPCFRERPRGLRFAPNTPPGMVAGRHGLTAPVEPTPFRILRGGMCRCASWAIADPSVNRPRTPPGLICQPSVPFITLGLSLCFPSSARAPLTRVMATSNVASVGCERPQLQASAAWGQSFMSCLIAAISCSLALLPVS